MDDHLNLYYIFYIVANTENISRAARKLFITQPSISKSINRLENELNTQLFIRTSRGVRLTDEGRVLYEHVSKAFDVLQKGEQQLLHLKEQGISQLRIGVSTTLCKYMLLPYLKYFMKLYPNVHISIECQPSNKTLELLEQNKIDIGLVGLPEGQKKYSFYELMEIQDVFVASKSYMEQIPYVFSPELIDSNELLLEQNRQLFSQATIMLLDHQKMTRKYIDNYHEKNRMIDQNLFVVTTMDLLIEFCKIGLGIGCVIREFVQKELDTGLLIEIPLGIPIHKRKIGFVTAKQSYISPIVHDFITQWKPL